MPKLLSKQARICVLGVFVAGVFVYISRQAYLRMLKLLSRQAYLCVLIKAHVVCAVCLLCVLCAVWCVWRVCVSGGLALLVYAALSY